MKAIMITTIEYNYFVSLLAGTTRLYLLFNFAIALAGSVLLERYDFLEYIVLAQVFFELRYVDLKECINNNISLKIGEFYALQLFSISPSRYT